MTIAPAFAAAGVVLVISAIGLALYVAHRFEKSLRELREFEESI